jgi:DnaD/phage-associated family protein
MNIEKLTIEETQLRKLMGLKHSDAALLYLYLRSGNAMENAARDLGLHPNQLALAEAGLRQTGLWSDAPKATFVPGQRPVYTEADVMTAMDTDMDFRSLYGELQRLLGKVLTVEELKLLLGLRRYLGLPNEVISVLVCYCRERARQRGSLRNPSLRTIEKEAYIWAEQGIETLEQAAAYIQAQNLRNSALEKLKRLLQIRGRNLTPGEERYAYAWLDMHFDDEAISTAYERTCLNTGGLNWAYMNKILQRWHEAGLHTAEEIKRGDRKNAVPKAGSQLGQAELEAIAQIMKEG